jgi:hypothetical protein
MTAGGKFLGALALPAHEKSLLGFGELSWMVEGNVF